MRCEQHDKAELPPTPDPDDNGEECRAVRWLRDRDDADFRRIAPVFGPESLSPSGGE